MSGRWLPSLGPRFAGSIAGVPGPLFSHFQFAFPPCAFSLSEFGLQRGPTFRLLRAFGLTGFFSVFSASRASLIA